MKLRILFVYDVPSSFILQDRDLLANHAELEEFCWSEHRHPARVLTKWMLRNRRNFDLVFVWFGDAHASIAVRVARLLNRPSVIVVGGYDVSDVAGYGYLSTRRGRRNARRHFDRATRIVAVSRTLAGELTRRFPGTAHRVVVLPTGVDVRRFVPHGDKERKVLSVAEVGTWSRAWIKGFDRLAEVARTLPDIPFLLIGASSEIARRLDPPANLTIQGPVPQKDLVSYYQSSSVYLQASRSEGLPNTVMEAMACGCVPVVTCVGGMPELVDDVGFVVEEDPRELSAAVRKALETSRLAAQARERIVQRFSLTGRESRLVRVVQDAVSRPSARAVITSLPSRPRRE